MTANASALLDPASATDARPTDPGIILAMGTSHSQGGRLLQLQRNPWIGKQSEIERSQDAASTTMVSKGLAGDSRGVRSALRAGDICQSRARARSQTAQGADHPGWMLAAVPGHGEQVGGRPGRGCLDRPHDARSHHGFPRTEEDFRCPVFLSG